jgi:hypothetical protein
VDISWSSNKINPPPQDKYKQDLGDWAKNLSDFVTITQGDDTGFVIGVKNEAGILVYEMKGLVLDTY